MSFLLYSKAQKAKRGKCASLYHGSPTDQTPKYPGGTSGRGVPPRGVAGLLPWLHSASPCLWQALLCQTWRCLQLASTQPGSLAQSWPGPTEVLLPVHPDQSSSASSAFSSGNLRSIFKSRHLMERNTRKFGFSSVPLSSQHSTVLGVCLEKKRSPT